MFFSFLKQSINRKLWFCVLVTVVIMSGAVAGLFGPTASVWYLLDKAMIGSGVVSLLICVIPILPYGGSAAEEFETGILRYYTIRTGRTVYFANKVLVSFISGFLTMFLAQAAFILIFLPFYPLFGHGHTYYAYEGLMKNGEVLRGVLMFMAHMSLSGALMAAAAVFVSTVIPNKFAAISVPVIVYFTCSRIIPVGSGVPEFLNPAFIVEGIVGMKDPNTELLVKFCTVVILSALFAILGNLLLKRRIAHA